MVEVYVYLAGAPGGPRLHEELIELPDEDEPPQELVFEQVPPMRTRQVNQTSTRTVVGRAPRWDDKLESWVWTYSPGLS